ncbi:hypothetical protein [Streptomyces iconiensis]|uniref:Uncharacterized protein n=1 Tax=Streptomyces iconiensis TaxID=1384038 RepID=A0ABT7A2M9_9ACTN|nr:hypothetical protein [Streptomyces iconiensis]MDJ1135580.1 hypothetical protein [Streptomyces iconiensis]
MRMSAVTKSVAVAFAITGLIGAGAATAQASGKPHHNHYKHVNTEIEKEYTKIFKSDDDKFLNDNTVFVFGAQKRHAF